MYRIPWKVTESLNDNILTTLTKLGYDIARNGRISVGNQVILVGFRQAYSADRWQTDRNFGNISIEYVGEHTQIITRQLKITFAWKKVGNLHQVATDFHWSEDTTRRLKDKVKQVYQAAKAADELANIMQEEKDDFTVAVSAVFPDAEINNFSARIGDLEVYKYGDTFGFEFTYSGSGSLEDIKATVERMVKAAEEKA